MALKDWFKSVTGTFYRKDKTERINFFNKGNETEVVIAKKFGQYREYFKTDKLALEFAKDYMRTH